MSDLGDFFSLIGEAKKKEEKKTKDIIGEVSLDNLFSSLAEERKKIKEIEVEKNKEREKLLKDAKVFETFLFSEIKKPDGDPVIKLENGLQKLEDTSYESIDILMKDICREFDITPKQLHKDFKKKHGVIPDKWINQEEEVVDQAEEEIEESLEELETLAKIRKDVNVEVDKSNNILKSIEILDKLSPDEKIDDEGKDSDVNRLRREIDQLRKMVYETVRHTSTIGGGGAGYLKDLADVDIAGLENDYVLTWNATTNMWDVVPRSESVDLGPLAGIATMSVSDIEEGDMIAYDSATQQFITTSVVSASTTAINGIAITAGTPMNDGVLTFDGTTNQFVFQTPFNIVDMGDGTEDGLIDYGDFAP